MNFTPFVALFHCRRGNLNPPLVPGSGLYRLPYTFGLPSLDRGNGLQLAVGGYGKDLCLNPSGSFTEFSFLFHSLFSLSMAPYLDSLSTLNIRININSTPTSNVR